MDSPLNSVRIDKWLWAARFYKTRSIAKQAIEGGKIRVNGDHTKASREIAIGDVLRIRQGWDEKEIIVLDLSTQRKGAPEAQKLYQETEKSIHQRELHTKQRTALGNITGRTPSKPTSKQRRDLQRIKRKILTDYGEN